MAKMRQKTINNKLLIGRYEWCQLPELSIPAIKAKIDTGAQTSSLHAFNITTSIINKINYVNFEIHPLQGNDTTLIKCKSIIIDQREVMSSNGHKEKRYVISTPIKLGDQTWNIEVTLSNRDPLRFRMLLGREALNNKVIIDPDIKCNQGSINKNEISNLYDLRTN